jgi:hypothetical protein
MKNSLNMVRKLFPTVKKVVDATRPVRLEVTKADNEAGRRHDPSGCALAKACLRQLKADGAIINVSTSYVVKGDTATRYKTSETVAREITSFDRHQDFVPGKDYLLAAVSPSIRLDAPRNRGAERGPHKASRPHRIIHKTENIRVSSH